MTATELPATTRMSVASHAEIDEAIAWLLEEQEASSSRTRPYADDLAFFARACTIMDPVIAPEGMLFQPWDWQEGLFRVWQDNRLCVVLKARQLGVTWMAAVYALWVALFKPGQVVLLISIGQRESDKFLAKCKFILERLPDWMKPGYEPLARSIRFTNGSEIEALPATESVGRSRTASLVIADEHAFQDFADESYVAMDPVIQNGARFLSLSTANGLAPLHSRLYKGAKAGENGYVAVFIPWSAHPDRDEEWYDTQRRKFNSTAEPAKLAQEYPADDVEAFIATGNPVWTVEELQRQPIVKKEPDEPGLWIYEPPAKGALYTIGVDTAEGDPSSDWSSACVLRVWRGDDDAYHGVQVAQLRGKFRPEYFARLVHRLALRYAAHREKQAPFNVHLGIERNNHGHAVIMRVTDLIGAMPEQPYSLSWWGKKIGWLNTSSTKPVLVDEVAGAVREDWLRVCDPVTLDQMSTFQTTANGGAAQPGFHDDDVIALGIANLQMRRAFGNVLDVRR